MNNELLEAVLKQIPTLGQRQDALNDQLEDLVAVANRLGMYDAADYIYDQVVRTDKLTKPD